MWKKALGVPAMPFVPGGDGADGGSKGKKDKGGKGNKGDKGKGDKGGGKGKKGKKGDRDRSTSRDSNGEPKEPFDQRPCLNLAHFGNCVLHAKGKCPYNHEDQKNKDYKAGKNKDWSFEAKQKLADKLKADGKTQ